MTPPYLPASSLESYTGTFSFISSRLYTNIRRSHPTYDICKPKTFPYITLATIEKHCPYQGYPDLPEGVAYERNVLERYEAMYTTAERAESAMVNGPLHKRYPFNYDQFDKPKEKIGMSMAEYWDYVTHKTKPASQGSKIRKGCPSLCANWGCAKNKQEAAKLRGKLSEQRSELEATREDLKEYVARKASEIHNLEATVVRVQKDHTLLLRRAENAEQEYRILNKSWERMVQRVSDLEGREGRTEHLEKLCVRLQEQNAMLKRGRTKKRPREEPDDGVAGSNRASKNVRIDEED
jgi:hypothetical protein